MKHFLPFLLVGFLVCCNSPEAPEPPKIKAIIDFEITQLPFTIYYDYWDDVWYADLTLLFTESAGIGAALTSIKVNWLLNNASIASTLVAGKRIPAHGAVSIGFRTEFPAKYKPQIMIITASGTDDNGYSFSKKKSYDITWTVGQDPRINKNNLKKYLTTAFIGLSYR